MGDDLDAWAEATDRLAALGRRLGDDDYPGLEADRADGVAHVVEQSLCWMGWSVFHADPRRPTFQRQNDLITQWGGPNADNVYRHARVEPGRRYRIRGRMHSCEEFILAVRAGFMHLPTWGTLLEVTASELGIGEGDEFDFEVGEGGAVPLPEGALTVSIREYYFDWREAEPATFTIECLDADAADPPGRRTATTTASQLREGVDGVAHSVEYWNTYMREKRGEGVPNTFNPAFALDKGLDAARYAFCFWDLGPDEALIVEVSPPAGALLDLPALRTGLVRARRRRRPADLAQPHPDGHRRRRQIRLVVSHTDPGVPQLARRVRSPQRAAHLPGVLDDRRRARRPAPGSYRSARRSPPCPRTRLAPTRPSVTPVMAARRRHLAWRFRT